MCYRLTCLFYIYQNTSGWQTLKKLLWSVGKLCLWYASVTAENKMKWWLLSAFCRSISVFVADSVSKYICQDLWEQNLYFVFSDQTCRSCLSSEQYSFVCQKYGNICNNIEMCVISVLLYYYTKLLIAFEI